MEAMQRPAAATKVYQDFVPASEIVEEPQCNTLVLYLPGFKKEQLRVQLTTSRNLVISGEHLVGQNTWRRFQKTVPIPVNCDSSKITAKFEDQILYITQPKLIASAEKQDQKATTSKQDGLTAEKQDQETPSSKIPESLKQADEKEVPGKGKQVPDHKQEDKANAERKETAEENVGKIGAKGGEFKNAVQDSSDGKTVSDDIPEVEQAKKTADTGNTKEDGDQKHSTYSGIISTDMNMQKKVISIVVAIAVAIAFGLHVYYLVGRGGKAVKEEL